MCVCVKRESYMKFKGWFNSAAETYLLVNDKRTTSESIETTYSVHWGWDSTKY